MAMTSPRTLGPWVLSERLGAGGNAVVWRAAREREEAPVAVKVVNATKASKEPYQRFVREIEVLRQLGPTPGVLPVIDAYLPAQLAPDDRAWLAMPIATPVASELDGAPLERAVECAAQVATTLARLAREHQIAHRDIKPANLYFLDGHWLVGDFGLVAAPDVDELTRTGRPLGPAHYLSYEMLTDPTHADPFAADVFALAKTLWVLACGQNFPPPGHQTSATELFSVASVRRHENARVLDRLIDRMTRPRPEDRPGMEEVAKELSGWLALPSARGLDLGAAGLSLREKLREQLEAQDLEEQQRDQAAGIARRLQELFRPIDQALLDLHPRAELARMDDDFTQKVLRTRSTWGGPEIVWRWQRCSRIEVGRPQHPFALRIGRSLELTDSGLIRLHLYVDVGFKGLSGSDFHWKPPPAESPVGSVDTERHLVDGVNQAASVLVKAAPIFVENAPTS